MSHVSRSVAQRSRRRAGVLLRRHSGGMASKATGVCYGVSLGGGATKRPPAQNVSLA